MKQKLPKSDLLAKLVKPKELRILEVAWDEELDMDQKIDALLEN